MQRTLIAAVAAAALTAGSSGAQARADVTGTFAGAPVSQTTSGWSYVFRDVIGQALAAGTSQSWDFSYSITLHADGLPAVRDLPDWIPPSQCPTIPYGLDCGPVATGFETAQFDFGIFFPRGGSGEFTYTVAGLPTTGSFALTSGNTATFSGTFTVTETAASFIDTPFNVGQDTINPYAIAFVDAAAVPELPASAMLAAGLGLLAAWRRRR